MARQPKNPKRQIEAFRKAARELGCDEDEGRFQDVLRQIAKSQPRVTAKKRKAAR